MDIGERFVEITTKIGCPVNCQKYCPQEVTVRRYGPEPRTMTMPVFQQIVQRLPKDVTLIFAGFCEPFANRNAIDFMKYAQKNNRQIDLYTTLYDATDEDVDELIRMKFHLFCLHLPDGSVMKEPPTSNYRDHVFTVLQQIPNINTISMNDTFKTNNRENVVRGKIGSPRRLGYCLRLEKPRPIILPNGDAYLCCMDFGLKAKLGNILIDSYETILQRITQGKGRFPDCYYCSENKSRLSTTFWQGLEQFRDLLGRT